MSKIKNCLCMPEGEDDLLYILVKTIHKGRTYGGVIEVSEGNKTKTHVEHQGKCLIEATVRTLIKNNIIAE